MRRVIMMGLLAAIAAPSIVQAQSAAEIRHDNREIREDQRDLRAAQIADDQHGKYVERRELRRDQQERREDWQDYRQAHRDIYRRPAYVGPRGHVYRPVVVGYRFAPNYYSSRYVIADPWRYRLHPAAGYTRWIRYGNDVVLVNVRSGHVIEVHRDFFW